jgi:hypothetical protein
MRDIKSPITVAICNGLTLKDVMPLVARETIFLNEYPELP